MRKAVIFIALGLILLGLSGWLLFPNVRSDILEMIPFFNRDPKAVTLTYWGLWETREVIQPLLDQYQKENPYVTIEYEQRDPREYMQLINARLGVDGGPDIVRVHQTWVPFLINKLSPLSDSVMTTAQYEQTYYPVNNVLVKQNGKYYGIPLMVDGLALVYNRDLFNESGYSIPPGNWETFRDMTKILTKFNSSGQMVQSGAALGYADNVDYFVDILGLMFAQSGVQFADAAGNVTFHNSYSTLGGNLGVEALRFYQIFAQSEQSWDPTWGNSTDEFARGRVAMVFLPSHRLHEIFRSNPTFPVGVAPVPQLPKTSENQPSYGWANYWVESVSKSTNDPEEAWKFLKWMSEKEQLTTFYRVASNTRSFGEPYPRVDAASTLSSDLYTLPYVQQGPIYTTWYFNSGVINTSLNTPIETSLRNMINTINAGGNPETELTKVAGEVQTLLNNYPR